MFQSSQNSLYKKIFRATTKTFSAIFSCLFSLFRGYFAAKIIIEDNVAALQHAAGGRHLESGKHYAIIEKWPTKNRLRYWIAGYSHTRLIVGTYKANKTQETFAGTAYDLIKDNNEGLQGYHGVRWSYGVQDT